MALMRSTGYELPSGYNEEMQDAEVCRMLNYNMRKEYGVFASINIMQRIMKNKNTKMKILLKIMLIMSICIILFVPQTIASAEDNDISGLILDDCEGYWSFSEFEWTGEGGTFYMQKFPDKMTIRTGDTVYVRGYVRFEDNTYVSCFDGKVTSGDESIITVNGEKTALSSTIFELKAINAGTVTVTIVSSDYNGEKEHASTGVDPADMRSLFMKHG